MNDLKVKAEVVSGVGQKSGKEYKAIRVSIGSISQMIFLTKAEWKVIELEQKYVLNK